MSTILELRAPYLKWALFRASSLPPKSCMTLEHREIRKWYIICKWNFATLTSSDKLFLWLSRRWPMEDDITAFYSQLQQYLIDKSIRESETWQIFANIRQFFHTTLRFPCYLWQNSPKFLFLWIKCAYSKDLPRSCGQIHCNNL